MITLEENKIYKVVHSRKFFGEYFPRDYIICCPTRNYSIDDSKFVKISSYLKTLQKLECVFTIDFNGTAQMYLSTTVFEDCHFEELDGKDILDIKKAFNDGILKGYKYNRKLNKLIAIDDIK